MKKIIILLCISAVFTTQAQFLDDKPPTELELKVNNSNDVAALMKLAHDARKNKDYKSLVKVMEKVVKKKPFIPALKYQLAQAYSLAGNKSASYDTLIKLQKQGVYFDLQNDDALEIIKPHKVFDYIKKNMDVNGEHYGEGAEVFNINKSFSGLLFESLEYDKNSDSFLMGSLRDGSVIKIENNGKISRLIEAAPGGPKGPWAALNLAVDEKNDILWVGSAAISQFGKVDKETGGMAGLFKYQLSTGKLLTSVLIPENKRPSFIRDMHLTDQGDLYFIDGIKNLVLKIEKDSDQIKVVFSTGKYQNLRTITSDDTGTILYLSDNEEGIIVLNLTNQDIYNFPNQEALNLTGISDMIFDDNSLVILQNGFKPERILRLKLNDSKFVIEHMFPIESGNPDFNGMTYATIVDEGIFYIANSQLPKTNLYGGLIPGQQWEDMKVLSSPKHYKEKETLQYQKEIEEQKYKTGTK